MALNRSEHSASSEQVAKPTEFGELIPAAAAILVWLILMTNELTGRRLFKAEAGVGYESSFILLIALPLAAWTLLMRLRWNDRQLSMTIGPRRRRVNLNELVSVKWRMTGGWRSRGTIFVRDRSGGQLPIYVGRFQRVNEWGPLLLAAATITGARVDPRARRYLEATKHERTRK